MSNARFKVEYVPRWKKLPLMLREAEGFRQIGWVSGQRAYLVNNLHHGWVAFVNDQTPENIDCWFCPHCGASIWGSMRDKIVKAIKNQLITE